MRLKSLFRHQGLVMLLLAALAATLQWAELSQRLTVCADLAGTSVQPKLYWDSGMGFNERQSRWLERTASKNREHCAVLTNARRIVRLRLDPQSEPGMLKFGGQTVRRPDALLAGMFEVFGLDRKRIQLSSRDAVLHQLEWEEERLHSVGNDPYLIWMLGHDALSWRNVGHGIADFSLYSLIILIAWGWIGARHRRRETVESQRSVLWVWLLYPVYGIFSILPGSPLDLGSHSQWVILGVLLLGGVGKYIQSANRIGRDLPVVRDSVLVVAVLAVLAVDLAGHLLRSGQPPTEARNAIQYHWSLDRVPRDNLRHSGRPYRVDVAELRERLEPNTFFFSDRATNYYISASLPLYGANPHPHHQIHNDEGYSPFFPRGFVRGLCSVQGLNELFQALRKKTETLKRFGWLPLRYLIINTDTVNRNVRGNCLTRKRDAVISRLASYLTPVYEGEHLIVYELGLID